LIDPDIVGVALKALDGQNNRGWVVSLVMGKELMFRESSSKRGREAFSKGDIVRRMEEDRERVCLLASFPTSSIYL
jgi:hypothetical protein